VLPGGLSEYLVIKTENAYLLDEKISIEEGVFAEPLGCVVTSVMQGKIEIGDDVMVIGGGVMGMLHILCSKLSGARVTLSEPNEKRAEFAKQLGVDYIVNPNAQDPVQFIKDITGGRGAEVVFNTTPVSALVEQGLKMIAPAGRFLQYSSMHPDNPVPISPNWIHDKEVILTGTKSPHIKAFTTSVDLINKGIINVKPLLSEAYDMADADTAFERAMSAETYRVMIRL
jgi:L-iditol 2-dehydrogenase